MMALFGGILNFLFAGLPIYLLRAAGEQGSLLVLDLLNSGTMPLGALFFGQFGNQIPIAFFFVSFGMMYLLAAASYMKITDIRTFSLEDSQLP